MKSLSLSTASYETGSFQRNFRNCRRRVTTSRGSPSAAVIALWLWRVQWPCTGQTFVYAWSSLFFSRLHDASMQRTTATPYLPLLQRSVGRQLPPMCRICIQMAVQMATLAVDGQLVAMHRIPPASRVVREVQRRGQHAVIIGQTGTFVPCTRELRAH